MTASKLGACHLAVLILAIVAPARAQSQRATPAQPSPARATPRAGPATQAAQEPAKPEPERKRRSKRKPRTSSGEAPPAEQGVGSESRRSRDPGPTRQRLVLTTNIGGGYDDNVVGGQGSGLGVAPRAMVSGYTARADGTLAYFRGNMLRSIQVDTTGSLIDYPGYLDHPAAGGVAVLNARTTAGRNLAFRLMERVASRPMFTVLPVSAGDASLSAGASEESPVASLFERRSLSSDVTVAVDRRWGRADSTSLSYSYSAMGFTQQDYGHTASHNVAAAYRKRLATGVWARTDYAYTYEGYTDSAGDIRPTREHRIEAGPEISKLLSRRRRLELSLTGGAAYLKSNATSGHPAFETWVPIGSGRLTLELSPTWSVEGRYRRGFSRFRGVTDDVYTTDTASLAAGGLVTSRIGVRVATTYGNWSTPASSAAHDRLGVYGASVGVHVLLSDSLAATAGYYYYHHRYSDPGALPEGFPAKYDRYAVRVGLTLRVPLMGSAPRSDLQRP